MGQRMRVSTWFRPYNPNNITPAPFTGEEVSRFLVKKKNMEGSSDRHFSQLTQLGFNAYAIDLINYPEGMEFFLKVDVRIHRLVSSNSPYGSLSSYLFL